jgi:hypothetical protein
LIFNRLHGVISKKMELFIDSCVQKMNFTPVKLYGVKNSLLVCAIALCEASMSQSVLRQAMGLSDLGIVFHFSEVEINLYLLLSLQTGSGAHPGWGYSSRRLKLTTHLQLMTRLRYMELHACSSVCIEGVVLN